MEWGSNKHVLCQEAILRASAALIDRLSTLKELGIKNRRALRFWGIVPFLTRVLTGFVAYAKLIGLGEVERFPCIVMEKANSQPFAVDLNRVISVGLREIPYTWSLVGQSPDGKFTVNTRRGKDRSGLTSGLILKWNSGGVVREFSDLVFTGVISWSPDGRFVAISGFQMDETSQKGSPALLIAKTDGAQFHVFPATSAVFPAWSSDSANVFYSTGHDTYIVQVKDFSSYLLANRPLAAGQWLPGTHKLIITWGQPARSNYTIFDFDTKAEKTYQFSLQAGEWSSSVWSPDNRYLVILRSDGSKYALLKVVEFSQGAIQNDDTVLYQGDYDNYFWLPNNRALLLVTDKVHALVSLTLGEAHGQTIVADGVEQVIATSDSQKYMFTRRRDDSLSLNVLNLADNQVSLLTTNVGYVRETSRVSDSRLLLVVHRVDATYAIDLYDEATASVRLHIADGLPALPQIAPSWDGSGLMSIWKSASGGGLSWYSLQDHTSRTYHVSVNPRWDLTETRFSVSPDQRRAAISLREPNGTQLQLATLENFPPIILYTSQDSYNWGSPLLRSADSSAFFYGINHDGPARLVDNHGSEMATLSEHGEVTYSGCDEYFSYALDHHLPTP